MEYINVVLFTLLISSGSCHGELNFKTLDTEVGPVVYVNLLFRHGDRTPITVYPKDPYKDISYWPLGLGELTKEGIYHHFVQGSWVGKRYAQLLPKNRRYHQSAIRILSTDVDRTLMSAEAHLAGMFPITEEQKWGGIDWQPIPIHTVPEQLDKVLAVKHPCKKYHYEKEKLKQSAVYKDLMKKLQPLGEYVSKYTGEPFTSLRIFEYLYSILLVEKMNNLTLPEWTESVFPDQLKVLAGYSLAVPTWTPEMKRLRGGPLVKEILENMKKKIAGTLEPPTRNISIYSAHESTVSAFLNTIDAFDFLPPPFASMVLVELRKTAQNDHVVMVLYKNSTDPTIDPYILTVPGCSAACPLNDFEALLKPIIPVDWDLECQHQENVEPALNQRFDSLAIFGVLFRTPAGSNFTKK